MRRSLFALAFALLVGVFGAGTASAQSRGDLKCESWNYQPARCPVERLVDARISSVIAGQCYQGRSWGFDRGGIWVNNGCRARFTYETAYDDGGYPGGYPGAGNQVTTVIKCESWNYQDARCPIDTRGGVEMSRRIKGDCIQGRTWGYDRGGIWVSNGCRAEFRVGYGGNWNGNNGGGGGGYYPPQNQGYRVKCQSFNYQPARCPASIRVGVRITNIIGGACKMNRSWGWDRGGIWVNNGCRAEFMVDG